MTKKSQIEEIERVILTRLLDKRYIGANQSIFNNVIKYVERSQRGYAKTALDNLIRRGFLATKKKHYDIHISILPDKIDEVNLFLREQD